MACRRNKKNKTRKSGKKIVDDFIRYRSGNKVVDNFIRNTQINGAGSMEFASYDQFKDIEFFAEGGFSKLYKATWIIWTDNRKKRKQNYKQKKKTVILKRLHGSENITSKDLNELQVFYDYCSRSSKKYDFNYYHLSYISNYYGITQDPRTKDYMIIMDYYCLGDLRKYITNNFEESWYRKLNMLNSILWGLYYIHRVNIIHRDFHSGNIIYNGVSSAIICDLGISKSSNTSTDDDEIYGIIPYVAPEVFRGQKYTKASDIYSFGMIMWEFMTGRMPFWNQVHDTELIIQICDGFRPPIVTNAPKGYVELMQKCWHSDPNERPTTRDILKKLRHIEYNEQGNPTKIIPSSDIGPVKNNSGAIYESRPLSGVINSAMSTRSTRGLKSQYNTSELDDRKFDDYNIKKSKLSEDNNNEYMTEELCFDI